MISVDLTPFYIDRVIIDHYNRTFSLTADNFDDHTPL